MLLKRRIFSFYVLFIILTLILIMHTIALAGWFGFTGASFSQTCDNISNYTTSYDICPKDGPAMSIFIELFLAFAEVYFYIVYLSKSKALPPKDNLVKG